MKEDKNKVEEVVEETQTAQPEVQKTPEQELAECKDAYLRLAAEYDNYRKRTAKNLTDMSNIALEKLAVDVIGVVDDFNRMRTYIGKLDECPASDKPAQMEQIISGVTVIADKLNAALAKHNITKIEINKGDDFNVDFQDAVTAIPAGDEMSTKVVDCTLDGYKHGDKVIRFAKVVVGQ